LEKKTEELEQKAQDEKDMLETKMASLRDMLAHGKHKNSTEDHDNKDEVMVPHGSAGPSGSRVAGDAWADYLKRRGPPARAIVPPSTSSVPPQLFQNNNNTARRQETDTKYTATKPDLVWVKGYTRDLTTKQLKAEASRLLALHDIEEEDVEVIVRGFGRSFAIQFATQDLARDFREEARDAQHAWVDPRDKLSHPLRFHGDKPLFVRLRDRVFAHLWRKVLPKAHAKHPDAKLGQSRGKLWIIVNDCPYSVFSSRPEPDDASKFMLEADADTCQEYDISREEANTWMAQALRMGA
jgi:hypothetical protein